MDRPLRHTGPQPGERVIARWVAGLPSRGRRTAAVTGNLVLTNQRLIFEADRAPPPSPLFVSWRSRALRRVVRKPLALSDIESVMADPERPALLTVRSGNRIVEFQVSTSRGVPMLSGRNRATRDEAVTMIATAARSHRRLPPPES